MRPEPVQETTSRAQVKPWLIVVIWVLYGVISVNQSVLWAEINNRPTHWNTILAFTLCICVTWLAFTPLVIWAVRRWPVVSDAWQRSLLVHIPLALTLAAIDVHIDRFVMPRYDGSVAANFLSGYLSQLDINVFYYAVIAACITAADMYHKYRERQRKAAELHTELVTAKLESLKMQLQPHFLFNTLNAINALIHEDTEAADRMVTRLADLLRLTLYESRHEIPLARELEFISAYVEIQQIRFQNRLTVSFEVKGAVMGAVVPSLLLQPLVENAIRHGITPRARAGHVWIRAYRAGDELVLEVEDDGIGMTGSPRLTPGGIGLQNTRARLEQLYASAHELLIHSVEQRGTLVRIRLPYDERTTFDDLPKLAVAQ